LRVSRYLAELVKFRAAPPITIFRVFKGLLSDFSHHNVDICTALLEQCGRFLYLQPHTHQRMSEVLDTVLRLRSVRNLDVRQAALVEAAYFSVKPPERTKQVVVEFTTIQKFVYHLIAEKAGRATSKETTNIVRILRRLPWHDKKENILLHAVQATLKAVERVYVNIPGVARLLAILGEKQHSSLLTQTLDYILEEIRRALEVPYRREPQRLLGIVRLLGELYVLESINATTLYDTLFMIIHFGHEKPIDPQRQALAESLGLDRTARHARPNWYFDPCVQSDLDGPTDAFRAILVCELLNACASQLTRNAARGRLSEFLTYFQRWLLTKPSLAMHIEFTILDAWEVLETEAAKHQKDQKFQGPFFTRYDTMNAVQTAIEAIELKIFDSAATRSKVRSSVGNDAASEAVADEEIEFNSDSDDSGAESESESEEEDSEDSDSDSDSDGSDSDDSDSDDSDSENSDSDSQSDDETQGNAIENTSNIDLIPKLKEKTAQELADEDEFDKLFRTAVVESMDTARSAPKRANFDRMAIPAVLPKAKNAPTGAAPIRGAFKLLSRDSKGKVEARQIIVSDDSQMLAKIEQHKESQREERQRMKEQVIAMSELDQEGAGPRKGYGGGGGRNIVIDRNIGRMEGDLGLDDFLNESSQSELRAVQEMHSQRSQGGRRELPPLQETNPNRERW
jgi:regulator of nonsense transcripts 2